MALPAGFWAGYVLKLVVVAALLCALYGIGRMISRIRLGGLNDRRYVFVLESIALSPHVTLHVVRVGSRYFAVAAAASAVAVLAELEDGDVDRRRAGTAKSM